MKRPAAPLDILIVEDEALLAMDLEAMVEDTGHTVIAEAASLRAVAALGELLRPAVAFVDVQLAEGSSGIDVARFIRQRWPDTIIVFITANPLKIPPDYAGAHGVIAKPFSRTGLISAMRYIAEGIADPPPLLAQPSCFTLSESVAAAWAPLN